MNIDELKPGVETDELVAEALGIEYEVMGYDVLRHTDVGAALFQPSRDISAAFWAVERLGKLIEINLLPRGYARVNIYPDDNEFAMVTTGDEFPAMAISKAILKLKERNVSDGEEKEKIKQA